MAEAKKTTKRGVAAGAAKARKAAAASRARTEERARKVKARVAESPAGGFMNFVREQGVIGLAVGLAIGTAAGDTVKTLVEGFISPIVQLIVGSQEALATATWTLEIGGRTGDFKWGAFVSSFITLVATAFVIYLIIHYAKLDRMDRKKDD